MALKALSTKTDTTPPVHNTHPQTGHLRVTRSATRRAVDSPPPANSSANPKPPQPSPSASRKRKAPPDFEPDHEHTDPSGHTQPILGGTSKKPRTSSIATPSQSTPNSHKKGPKLPPSMAKPGPSISGGKDEEKSTPNVPESSKRKPSRSKKPSHDVDQSAPQPPSSHRRSKKATNRKSDELVPRDEQDTTNATPQANKKPLGTESRSGDDHSMPRRAFDEDDMDGIPESLRSSLLGPGRSPAQVSAALRSLHGHMSGLSQRMRDILNKLKPEGDPSVQLIALQDLSELLLISNEDNLSGQFSPDQFVKELVSLMQPYNFAESNPEMMLLACRCIANMMEALPASTAVVVYGGAVPILCQKLLEIDFIDLAEQALSTLEKISTEFPSSIVREGGLSACLNFLDFFATSTQRTAVTTAANCCKNIPRDSFSVVRDVMPTLLDVLSNSDQKVVEQGSICVARIVESFNYEPDKLEQLVSVDLLKAMKRLLQPGTTNLIGPNIHTQFLRVLSTTARASPKLSAELLKMDIVDTLFQILTGVSPPDAVNDVASQVDGVFIMQALIHRPREQISETLNVICEVLPPVELKRQSFEENFANTAFVEHGVLPYSGSRSRNGNQKRLDCLKDCDEELKRFAMIMFPTLTDTFSSTVNLGVRQKVLAAQLKMLSNLQVGILEDSLRSVAYASFLASILSQQDHPSLVSAAIQAADILLNRLLKVYGYQFYREGVMAEVTKLASESVDIPETETQNAKRENDQPVGITENTDENVMAVDEEQSEAESQVGHEIMSANSGDDDDGEEIDEDIHASDVREDMSPSPSESSSDQEYLASTRISGHGLNILAAKKFLEVHENSKAEMMKVKATNILTQLQTLAKSISEHYLCDHPGSGLKLFTDLARNFDGDGLNAVTSAELVQSEIVDTLLDVFNNPNESVKARARSEFLQVFMTPAAAPSASQSSTPFSVFVHKLQDLLSRAEHFEVVTVNHNAFDNNRSNPHNMLAKQLRIHLVPEDESDIPRSYRNATLSVHAIATLKTLDDYLRTRIILAERPRSSRHREGLSHTLAAFAAATGIPNPHHRLADRGGALTDPPPQSAPPDTPSTSKTLRKLLRTTKSETAPDAAPKDGKSGSSRRSSRRKQASSFDTYTTPGPPPERIKTPLECADEHQIDDDDDVIDESSALDAIVDDLDDDVDGENAPEPSAVNMEVASTGKVTARQEDGTRVATPQSSSAAPPPAQHQTPSSRSRDLASNIGFSATSRALSYAAVAQSVPQDWHVQFTLNGRLVPHHMTFYQAVQQGDAQADSGSARSIWSTSHVVKFKRAPGPPPAESSLSSKSPSVSLKEHPVSVLPASLHEHPQTSKILRMLNIFHEMNANLDDVLGDESDGGSVKAEALTQFVNTKLTAKLNRQLEEPLIVASSCLPKWSEDLARLYPFLFPFETRHLFLQSTSFGYHRCMARWQSQSSEEPRRGHRRDDRPYTGKLQRQKVRIQRSRILESACKVMEMYGGSPSILEIEYFDEVGTGLGPTLEFYSTVSKEFAKKKTNMWRSNDANERDQYAFAKNGLFPAPMTEVFAESEEGKKILYVFKMLGKFVARSMLDGRMIDISLNPIFFRVGNQPSTVPLSLGAVKNVDEHLAGSLKQLKQYATMGNASQSNERLSSGQKSREIQKGTINQGTIDDLSLDFTLPGYPEIELDKNGANTPVTVKNVTLYVDKVIDMTLGIGVRRQADAFRAGFSEVFPYSALKAFTPAELVMLFGRVEEDWSLETLCDSIKADHGYNMDSRSVRNLLQVMSELTLPQRRDFLQFVTGSPKLPIGGFKSLNPMFTVVCRPSEAPYTSDDFLVSVMTCQNYVKLPDYSDIDVLRRRLMTAITEGQGAFHLS